MQDLNPNFGRELNLMLSLHKQPNQLVITSLDDFKIVRSFIIPFMAKNIEIHSNNS